MKAWVVSGGGALIIQALDLIERHVAKGNSLPDILVGSSAGGLLSIMISHCGIAGARDEILEIKNRKDIFGNNNFNGFFSRGLWNSKPLQRRIASLQHRYKPQIPYWVCSYSPVLEKTIYLAGDSKASYLASTACIPILVEPTENLLDGGVTENTPLSFVIKKGAEVVDVFMCSAQEVNVPVATAPRNKIGVLMNVFEAMRKEMAADDLKVCRVKNSVEGYKKVAATIHYPSANVLGALDFNKMREAYERLKGERT